MIWFFLIQIDKLACGIKQFPDSPSVFCRNGKHLFGAKVVEIDTLIVDLRNVGFVCSYQDWFTGTGEGLEDFNIRRNPAFTGIDHQNCKICFLDCHLGLQSHLLKQRCFGIGFETPGINDDEGIALVMAVTNVTVPRHSWEGFNNGGTFSDQSIEKRGFAHVRSPNQGHGGVGHEFYSDVEVFYPKCVFFDEVPARLHMVSHQHGKHSV